MTPTQGPPYDVVAQYYDAVAQYNTPRGWPRHGTRSDLYPVACSSSIDQRSYLVSAILRLPVIQYSFWGLSWLY